MPRISYETVLKMLAILGLIGIGWFSSMLLSVPSVRTLFVETRSIEVPAHLKPVDVNTIKVTAAMSVGEIIMPADGYITSFSQSVRGTPDNSLRFTFVYDPSQKDPYCPEMPRAVFVMSVEKTPDISFPSGYGYFAAKGTRLQVYAAFSNPSDTTYESASIVGRITYRPASAGSLLEAYPIFLNAQCDERSLFVVPAHAARYQKKIDGLFTIPFDGRLTLLASHGHKYLQEILLTLNGKELWKTSPIHLPDGTNLGNPMYYTPYNGVPVKKGDTLDLVGTYSNPTNNPSDAMISMYIHLLPGTSTPQHLH